MTDQMTGQIEPTHINVIARLGVLSRQIKADDTFVFYFSGHRTVYEQQLLSVSDQQQYDDYCDTLELSATPLAKVSQILPRVKARQLDTFVFYTKV